MKTIPCPGCGTKIRIVPYGYGEIGVCEECGYLHSASKPIMTNIEIVKSIQELMGLRP
jgi:uncharacterized Zn finger protein